MCKTLRRQEKMLQPKSLPWQPKEVVVIASFFGPGPLYHWRAQFNSPLIMYPTNGAVHM